MVKRLALGFFLWCFVSLAAYAADDQPSDTVRLGYFNHAPAQYYCEKTGKVIGASIEFLEEMAKEIGVSIEWVGPLPIKRLLFLLEKGGIDGTALIIHMPGLEDFLQYSQKPYHFGQPVLVVPEESPLKKVTHPYDLDGMRIGWIGHPPSPFIKKSRDLIEIEALLSSQMWSQNLRRLISNDRIDAIHDLNSYTILFQAEQLNLTHKIRVLKLPEDPIPLHIAMRKASEVGRRFVDEFDKIFTARGLTDADFRKRIDDQFTHSKEGKFCNE